MLLNANSPSNTYFKQHWAKDRLGTSGATGMGSYIDSAKRRVDNSKPVGLR